MKKILFLLVAISAPVFSDINVTQGSGKTVATITTAGREIQQISAGIDGSSNTVNSSQLGTYTVTPGTGTFPITQTTATSLKASVLIDGSSNTVSATQSGTWNVGTVTAVTAISNALPAGTNNIGTVTGSSVVVSGSLAQGAADSGNPVKIGVVASSNTPTGVSEGAAGQIANLRGTRMGNIVATLDCPREQIVKSSITITSSTSETIILSSGAASVFNDLAEVLVLNTSATAARIDFRSGGGPTAGAVDFAIYVPAGETRGKVSTHPWPQTTAASNWTAQSSASVADIRVYGLYCKTK